MKRLLLFLMFVPMLHATTWFVRQNGSTYGTGAGTSWANAKAGLAGIPWASVAAGETVCIAGGSYTTDMDAGKSGGAGNPITLARARADHALCGSSSAGWSSAFDADVVQTNHSLSFDNFDNITIDGRTAETGGTWGWHLNNPGFTAESYASTYFNSQNIILKYVWFEGPGHVNYTGDSRAISLSAAGNASALLFDHVKISKTTTAVFINGVDSVTFDHLDMSDCSALNSASWHPNGIWAAGATNLTVKNSYFHTGTEGFGVGEGIFAEQSGGNTNWKIYGNVFSKINATGQKAVQLTSAVNGLLFYNNTCDDTGVDCLYINGGSCTGTSFVKNNLLNASTLGTCGTASNNVTAASTSVWVNRASNDYHIVSTITTNFPRDKGTALGSPYDVDPDGLTRGSDGTWDVGAYEYAAVGGGGSFSPTLSAAVGMTVGTVGGSTAYSFAPSISVASSLSAKKAVSVSLLLALTADVAPVMDPNYLSVSKTRFKYHGRR